jgi:hypothetical protein
VSFFRDYTVSSPVILSDNGTVEAFIYGLGLESGTEIQSKHGAPSVVG